MSKKLNGKKLFSIILPVLAVLAAATVVLCITAMDNAPQKDDAEILDVIDKFNQLCSTNPVIDIDISRPQDLTDAEKSEIKSQHMAAMNEVLTENSYLKNTYGNVLARKLSAENAPVSVSPQVGLFSSDIISKSYDGENSVTVVVETVRWEKYINQSASDSEYSVVFPVNKDTSEFVFKKENGVWKIDAYEIKTKLMEGDYALTRNFETYKQALDYAKSVMPENVYAK